jgi:hypothetical protein
VILQSARRPVTRVTSVYEVQSFVFADVQARTVILVAVVPRARSKRGCAQHRYHNCHHYQHQNETLQCITLLPPFCLKAFTFITASYALINFPEAQGRKANSHRTLIFGPRQALRLKSIRGSSFLFTLLPRRGLLYLWGVMCIHIRRTRKPPLV